MKTTLDELVNLAIREDVGTGDITTEAIVSEDLKAEASINAKQTLVVAGIEVAEKVFRIIDPTIEFEALVEDGSEIEAANTIATVKGKARSLLTAERTVLNFLQHLSGIATFTKLFTNAVKDSNVKILDTRKTTPGYRALEKYAVRMGDGENHRIGLFDRYLIKNNHIEIAGSITNAIEKAKEHRKDQTLIEVETRTLEEVNEAVKNGADIIMLDNMDPQMAKSAVQIAKGKAKLEISGNIILDNLLAYTALGIDYISVGAITHSAPAADINMLIAF